MSLPPAAVRRTVDGIHPARIEVKSRGLQMGDKDRHVHIDRTKSDEDIAEHVLGGVRRGGSLGRAEADDRSGRLSAIAKPGEKSASVRRRSDDHPAD